MTLTRFFTTSMILFSLVAISSASIGRYGQKPEASLQEDQQITCTKVDKQGYEMGSYSFTGASDEKGYFFATLYPSEVEDDCNLAECKAFLESSPLETCNVPTDDNNGVSGCPPDFYRSLSVKKMMLYSVKPLFYTSKPKSISNGY
ncbi:proline-rich protein 3-like [Vitis riparia]|uniref:proline-rich protein 3-like n=1 Tax=Vitis riparia TaxID=96939 RepID=UPI00155ACE5F|nr:proline-rich protein 3-like [Vitis riparia]